jgi:hypothetical protein
VTFTNFSNFTPRKSTKAKGGFPKEGTRQVLLLKKNIPNLYPESI